VTTLQTVGPRNAWPAEVDVTDQPHLGPAKSLDTVGVANRNAETARIPALVAEIRVAHQRVAAMIRNLSVALL
jgi:hypothetical protein